MPTIRAKLFLPTALVVGISVAMISKGDFFVAVFPLWFLSNLLRDIYATGKLFPYSLNAHPASFLRNQWFMITLVTGLWLGGVFD